MIFRCLKAIKKAISAELGEFFVLMQKVSLSTLLPLSFLPFVMMMDFIGEYTGTGNSLSELSWRTVEAAPMVFAVGVAINFAERRSCLLGFYAAAFYATGCFELGRLPFGLNMQICYGIFCGVCTALLYGKFKNIRVPDYLLFLHGERSTLCLIVLSSLVINLLLVPIIAYLDNLGNVVWYLIEGKHEYFSMAYGFFNRLLVPLGLHHLLHTFVALQLGTFRSFKGEVSRFMAGDKTSGSILPGFYPIALFGLPAAVFAIWLSLPKEKRQEYKRPLFVTAFTTLITGITEPVEFLFVFVSPFLCVLHALLTAASCFIITRLNVRAIFGYAPGVLDFLLCAKFSKNQIYIFLVGPFVAAAYFVVFYLSIKLFKIPVAQNINFSQRKKYMSLMSSKRDKQTKTRKIAVQCIDSLGGKENISELFACTTRLRAVLHNADLVDTAKLVEMGMLGINRLSDNYVQVVVGRNVDAVYKEMQSIMYAKTPEEKGS